MTALVTDLAPGSATASRSGGGETAAAPFGLPSLADAAPWFARFRPPFAFGDFFAPEDTILCALATRAALRRAKLPGAARGRVVELTAGGAVVLADALLEHPDLRGAAAELDDEAVHRARRNLAELGLGSRARVVARGLFARSLSRWIRRQHPAVVACNPPYIPEPPGTSGPLVASAGADGARHPRRALHVAARAGRPSLVLSWCSLGDPVGVVRAAARAGYALRALWVALITDGEYSGGVHEYVRTLPTAFLHEGEATLRALAPDGAARFAYLLLAGEFERGDAAGGSARVRRPADVRRAAGGTLAVVSDLVAGFAREGGDALARWAAAPPAAGLERHVFVAGRGDEIRLRALAHGPASAA